MCSHKNIYAHKVRVANNLMITSYESIDYMGEPNPGFKGVLNIYDASDPYKIIFKLSNVRAFQFDQFFANAFLNFRSRLRYHSRLIASPRVKNNSA
jgi:hypothetical protein